MGAAPCLQAVEHPGHQLKRAVSPPTQVKLDSGVPTPDITPNCTDYAPAFPSLRRTRSGTAGAHCCAWDVEVRELAQVLASPWYCPQGSRKLEHRRTRQTLEGKMALHKIGQDPESPDGKSPTIYFDDVSGNYLLQGWRVMDTARLAHLDLPAHETVIEFPRRMVRFFPEVTGADRSDAG